MELRAMPESFGFGFGDHGGGLTCETPGASTSIRSMPSGPRVRPRHEADPSHGAATLDQTNFQH